MIPNEINEQNPTIEHLFELAALLSKISDYDEVIRIIPLKISAIFKADISSIIMVNPRTQNTIKTIMRKGSDVPDKCLHLFETNIIGWMMNNHQSFRTDDISQDDRFKDQTMKQFGAVSLACVAMFHQSIQTGYIFLMNLQPGDLFSETDLRNLERFALILSPYLANAQRLLEFFTCALPEGTLLDKYRVMGLLGSSKEFIKMLKAIDAAARCNVRVILEGRSGTGKELIAKAIHKMSPRQPYHFVAVDCGAIPANLLESELFGHCKGAFTGAHADRVGLIEEADKGTLFLDEITNLDFEMQAKLLRVLQESEIRPLGSNRSKKVDVRVIAASSTPLTDLVQNGKFREDLFYRLHVYPICVPSLYERKEDIPIISEHLLRRFASEQKKQLKAFAPVLIHFMKNRDWPGNVRELENFIERMVTIASDDVEEINDNLLPDEYYKEFKKRNSEKEWQPTSHSLHESLLEYEEHILQKTLNDCGWNLAKAARILKISKSNIRYRMDLLRIRRPKLN